MPIFEVELKASRSAICAIEAASEDEIDEALDELSSGDAESYFDFFADDGWRIEYVREKPNTKLPIEYGIWDGKLVKPAEYHRLKAEAETPPEVKEWREYHATQPHLLHV